MDLGAFRGRLLGADIWCDDRLRNVAVASLELLLGLGQALQSVHISRVAMPAALDGCSVHKSRQLMNIK